MSDDGGPAFPCKVDVQFKSDIDGEKYWTKRDFGGMTLRDYFAAQALAGPVSEHGIPEEAAMRAYEYADAMLAERAKEGE